MEKYCAYSNLTTKKAATKKCYTTSNTIYKKEAALIYDALKSAQILQKVYSKRWSHHELVARFRKSYAAYTPSLYVMKKNDTFCEVKNDVFETSIFKDEVAYTPSFSHNDLAKWGYVPPRFTIEACFISSFWACVDEKTS